jgi:uncharacterized protein
MVEGRRNRLVIRFAKKVSSIFKENLKDTLVSVCLYGSAARGRLRIGSDIDFLVVLNNGPASYHKRTKSLFLLIDHIRASKEYEDIEKLNFQLEPSFLIFTVDEIKKHPPILIDISDEGLILYDRKDFLKIELRSLKKRLTTLGAIKKSSPQGHYWILKPGIQPGEIFEI